MYRKVMQISDALMWRYYELLTDLPLQEIHAAKKRCDEGAEHPMDVKRALARRIVTDFHSAADAAMGEDTFRKVVQQGQVPEDMPEHALPEAAREGSTVLVHKLLREIGLAQSGAEAGRKLKEGAVEINGEKQREMAYALPEGVDELVIRMGKKWARVRV